MLIGPGLMATDGHQHRKQRKLLTPVFSVGHLRNMTHIFYDVAHKVRAFCWAGKSIANASAFSFRRYSRPASTTRMAA